MGSLRHLRETIRLKMLDQAPGLYAKMAREETLEAYLDEAEQELASVLLDAVAKAKMQADKAGKSHLDTVGIMNQAQSQMLEAVISELEFPMN